MPAMNCLDAEGLFDAYLDGELSGTLRLEFDTHRLHCPVCQQKLALLEATEYVIATDTRGPRPADDFTDALMSALEQRTMAARPLRLRRPLLAAAVLLQAAAVVGFVALLPALWKGSATANPAVATISLAELRRDAAVEAARSKADRALDARDREGMTAAMVEWYQQAKVANQRDLSTARDFALSFDLPGFGNGVSVTSLLQSIFGINPAETGRDRASDSSGSL